MKITVKHLLNFLKNKPSIKDLSSKLFQLGHEHVVGSNNIFDMELTPNRGDCLSVYGLARDLNVFYETSLDINIFTEDIPSFNLNFKNDAKDKCSQISFLNIEIDGKIKEYHDYLESYFKDLKINKNNFFTDISNYIAYEMGQPTHCYEFSAIGKDIKLKENNTTSTFKTCLGNTIELSGKDLVFTSDEEIINLAGIVGGQNTACDVKTNNVLIECAYFKPESIIGKAVKYNLHSEASHKFERGTDPNCHEKILRRFIQIVSEHANITKIQLYKYNLEYHNEVELDLDINCINRILGTDISEKYYKDTLINLGFEINEVIKVPSFRNDISQQNDLAEELARVVGYDNVPVSSINLKKIAKNTNSSKERIFKRFLINNGFNEVINSPFCPTKNSYSIKVDNPLDKNRKYIRTNLTDSLLENVAYNEKRQKDSIKLFEISDIYTSNSNSRKRVVGIIVSGRRGQNYLEFSQKLDINYLKNLFNTRNVDIEKFIQVIDRSSIDSKIKTPIYSVELELDIFLNNFNEDLDLKKPLANFKKYQKISDYPSSVRDFSFLISDISNYENFVKSVSNISNNYLKHSFIFDLYKNEEMNQIKVGVRMIFQSKNKTLSESEIQNSVNNIIKPILEIDGVSIPGML